MTSLLSNHDDALFACVSSILDGKALALPRHDEAMQIIAAMLRVTERAISAFAERWNAARPSELLVDCFQYLSFTERLLWTKFSIRKQDGKLEALLRRTQSAPLSLRLLLTDAEETALRPHFGRIRELQCRNPPARLDAPLLETLVVEGTYSEMMLSQDYVGSSAQSLRMLHLRVAFTIAPAFPVFSNLRELKARFTIETGIFPLCVDMGLALPAVTTITLVAKPEHDRYTMPQSPNWMMVPRLRYFAFTCYSGYAHNRAALQWFFVTLPSQLRSWISYDSEKLDTLALEGPVAKTALKKVSHRQSGPYSLAKETRIDPSAV